MNATNKRIILASGSPRRKELLKNLEINFEVITLSIDETMDDSLSLNERLKNLAYRKAEAIFKSCEDSLVIGADTIVVIDGKILGKPKNRQDAYDILKTLSGRTHEVKTGVAIITKEKSDVFISTTKVNFAQMSDDEIYRYIETSEPMDKAGAYGIQGYGSKFITSIDGDYYTVMGLPINMLYNYLRNYL